jgi:DNA-binding NtrC family response regulator
MDAPGDIVIYEEDGLTRALLQEWLGKAGYRVRCGSPQRADRDAPCKLVIVSVFMPKQAGAEYVQTIQAAHPDTPVIAISGQFRPGLAAGGATAQVLGVRSVVAKPLCRQDLLGSVRGIIGASSAILHRPISVRFDSGACSSASSRWASS